MSTDNQINYCIKSAERNKEVMQILFNGGKFVYSHFFAHLFIEKISKALWIKNKKDPIPPKTHNILLLLREARVSLNDND